MAFLHRPVALLLLIAPISLLVPLRTDAAATRASTSLMIPLNVSLGNSESVNATVTASTLSISNGTLTVNGSLSGTATMDGTSATLSSDAFTLTAQATCNGTTGTLTLTTSAIAVALSIGLTGQLQPLALTGTATCSSATSTLQGTTSPITVTLSDGTVLPLSCPSCASGVTITAPSTTTLANQICTIQGEICDLAGPSGEWRVPRCRWRAPEADPDERIRGSLRSARSYAERTGTQMVEQQQVPLFTILPPRD